ncbi:MAG: hypothetical protein SVT52_09165 [Planctomycetota bacterium]|nr:hypothetical protein [Planctomycetota bacterium]
MHSLWKFVVLTACVFLAGCGQAEKSHQAPGRLRVEPLPVQQAKAYGETVTGLFVSLADFEPAPSGPGGHEQVNHFSIRPGDAEGRCRFVVNITRTGTGAMEVTLAPKAELVFTIPHLHNFTGYTLLSMALHSETLRDDLRLKLTTETLSFSSHRMLVRPGWNNVLVDIHRMAEAPNFDATAVKTLRIVFADATGPVVFHLDDIMLIDNGRQIKPTPPGITLRKVGLDYTLRFERPAESWELLQHADGLWRFSRHQPVIQLAGPGQALPADGEQMEQMGRRRLGQVEILEHNTVRLRLANTWYFPTRAGQWASMAVRRIRWEHSFYADGRRLTHLELNNAGGKPIHSVRIAFDEPVAWFGHGRAKQLVVEDFTGPVGRWDCLAAPHEGRGELMEANYLNPGRLKRAITEAGTFADGDHDRDGFDQSQGCYFIAACAGHCRFSILPPPEGLLDPTFRVVGQWRQAVYANSEGLAIRKVVSLPDGSVLFVLPGWIKRPTAIEVSGKVPFLPEKK